MDLLGGLASMKRCTDGAATLRQWGGAGKHGGVLPVGEEPRRWEARLGGVSRVLVTTKKRRRELDRHTRRRRKTILDAEQQPTRQHTDGDQCCGPIISNRK
jgi:hypothetical protein